MKFLHRNATEQSWWSRYKACELIADSVPEPQTRQPIFSFGCQQIWQHLVERLIDDLEDSQQIAYLERCWLESSLSSQQGNRAKVLQKLWNLMH